MSSRGQDCYPLDCRFAWKILQTVCYLKKKKSQRERRKVDHKKKEENKATVTDRWAGRGWRGGCGINTGVHCRSDGSQSIKIEMPDLICVPFAVTLHCVSLSECHIPFSNGSSHHRSLPHTSAHIPICHFCIVIKRRQSFRDLSTFMESAFRYCR